jgi:hypothetical protein
VGNIPENITREDILKAIEEIDQEGIPPKRGATKYDIKHGNNYYPPKYTISLANKYANGSILSSNDFYGGEESNSFLRRRGFEIVER